jgi:hypothetical protein
MAAVVIVRTPWLESITFRLGLPALGTHMGWKQLGYFCAIAGYGGCKLGNG